MPDYQIITDRLEFILWAEKSSKSKSSLKEDIQALLASADAEEARKLANEVFECVTERKALLKDKYPFEVTKKRIKAEIVATNQIVYIFCLALSVAPPKAITFRMRDYVFECLAGTAAVSYFGGERVQTGANWAAHGHGAYGDIVVKISTLIHELGKPRRLDQPGGGDAGWDVMLVKQFSDKKYPRLIVAGNCATGKTDWLKKGNETVLPYWFRRYFDKTPYGPYLEFLAAPFAADEDERLRKTGDQTFLFDRFRLAEHGTEQPEMTAWLAGKAQPEAKDISLF